MRDINWCLPQPVLMLVTESGDRVGKILDEAIYGGVNVVQIRDKSGSTADVFRAINLARSLTWQRALLLVNCSEGPLVRVARWVGANGIHIPERSELTPTDLCRQEAGKRLVGQSVHSVESARRAAEDGMDYLIAGTVFESQSHPGELGKGIEYLREVCEAVAPLPVIAIGGITAERVGECIAAGAAGVAVLSPIMRANDPRAVAARYREELDKAWNLRSTEKA